MIITFDPMINTGASIDAAYMNFLRCITAAATAAAGTTTLTVNPFTNNTGTVDSTKNCIVSIDSNTEAGGWTTSASHNVPNSGAFTAIASAAAFTYKADFYNASGKSAYPYNKFSAHAIGRTTASMYSAGISQYAATPVTTGWGTIGTVEFTVGCSSSSDWTDTAYAPPSSGYYNQSPQNNSFTLNCYSSNYNTSVASRNWIPSFYVVNTSVVYKVAVTKDYVIVWEQPKANSYLNGYGNVIGSVSVPNLSARMDLCYGSILYMGLRETQPWEQTLNNNPPWVCFHAQHMSTTGTVATGNPSDTGSAAAYLATINNVGVASTTATRYHVIDNTVLASYLHRADFTESNGVTQPSFGVADPGRSYGIDCPLYRMRDTYGAADITTILHAPVADPDTGALVPPAHPIVFKRTTSDSWTGGGAARGIYKSLSMSWPTMKNYFSDGQTFTVGSDTYMPIVFNETMYLIRKA